MACEHTLARFEELPFSCLGIVPQQPFLFSGSVIENIRYGNSGATLEEINEIALSIGNGEWLDSLPDGWTRASVNAARV